MTASVRAPIADLKEGERRLDAPTSRYLHGVLRLHEGDRLTAFDPVQALEAEAIVAGVEHGAVILRIGPTSPARVVAQRRITWVQGVAKGEKMDAIVRDATELGATRFVPALSAFSVVKLDGPRGEARRKRWERIAREAARQCGRGDTTEIVAPQAWRDALDAAGAPGVDAAHFCLYERAEVPLGPTLALALQAGRPLAFAVGPEGGLEAGEVEHAVRAGWTVASLGAFVLRTETVAAAVLGAVRVFGR
jgi:16S rRNA (uracil1498-N3)-methyltransferase